MLPILTTRIGFIPRLQTIRTVYGFSRIGCRDIVGHGINGSANYKDDALFPFPAVRFKENTRDVCVSKKLNCHSKLFVRPFIRTDIV